jgi:ketol-acid reductoisomerase
MPSITIDIFIVAPRGGGASVRDDTPSGTLERVGQARS